MLLISAAVAGDLLLAHGRVWDGTGGPVRTDTDVLVHDDRIVAVGPGLTAPDGAQVIDATGATVIPGLIDGHVHLSMDPGAGLRADTREAHADLMARHLRAYVACGVTTILDPAVLPEEAALARSILASGVPGPRYLTLGMPFSPPGGYVAAVIPGFPSVATPADVERQLDETLAGGAVGVKVTVERGLAPPIWPLHPPEILHAISEGATARGLRVYAHAMSPEEQTIAIDDLHASVLVHPPDRYDRTLTTKAAAAGVYEMTTLSVLDALRTAWVPARLEDPLVQRTVPEIERSTAADPAAVRRFETTMVQVVFPRSPLRGLIRAAMFTEGVVGGRLRRIAKALHGLRDAGVPVVMGSDSGNWPIFPFLFHGPTSLREIELLGDAGFSPAEALASATRTPARMLGIDAGTIEAGHLADLVVLDGDPLADLRALRTPRWVVRVGVARTPEQWLAD